MSGAKRAREEGGGGAGAAWEAPPLPALSAPPACFEAFLLQHGVFPGTHLSSRSAMMIVEAHSEARVAALERAAAAVAARLRAAAAVARAATAAYGPGAPSAPPCDADCEGGSGATSGSSNRSPPGVEEDDPSVAPPAAAATD